MPSALGVQRSGSTVLTRSGGGAGGGWDAFSDLFAGFTTGANEEYGASCGVEFGKAAAAAKRWMKLECNERREQAMWGGVGSFRRVINGRASWSREKTEEDNDLGFDDFGAESKSTSSRFSDPTMKPAEKLWDLNEFLSTTTIAIALLAASMTGHSTQPTTQPMTLCPLHPLQLPPPEQLPARPPNKQPRPSATSRDSYLGLLPLPHLLPLPSLHTIAPQALRSSSLSHGINEANESSSNANNTANDP